ncbi:hypothetical protein GCM10011519_28840 [Marmoricola endophyticus]|uniref:Zinc-finger domain-containing protein n=1 Tax=Marmoricola endophyticus TaxID=2040280 RepID=A0A917F7C9_9ACTN|nr:zf-HC2 domain-containing protein [Marmoricola endophyticus]GGF53143.1 hypothetical protein GCM10011519_28840 [Marmoricola endophyticus]
MLGLRSLPGPSSGPHLGDRASALVDGQLSAAEAARAWDHVEACEDCHQEVQRHSWLKSRLSAFSTPAADPAPTAGLMGALYDVDEQTRTAWHETDLIAARTRRRTLTVVGAGSLSAAVIGVLALTGAPAGLNEPVTRPAPARLGATLAGTGAAPRGLPEPRRAPSFGPVPVGLRGPAH